MGNAAELRRHKDVLVRMLAGDALQPVTKGGSAQAVAVHLLGALIGAHRGTEIAAEIWQANIPQAILKSIPTEPYNVLMKAPSQSKAALHVIEAQLGLLLQLPPADALNPPSLTPPWHLLPLQLLLQQLLQHHQPQWVTSPHLQPAAATLILVSTQLVTLLLLLPWQNQTLTFPMKCDHPGRKSTV